MVSCLYNRADIEFEFRPHGGSLPSPLLVKKSRADGATRDCDRELYEVFNNGGAHNGPDTVFLRGFNDAGVPALLVPGSSLKGVFRSQAEWICELLDIPHCDLRKQEGTGRFELGCGNKIEHGSATGNGKKQDAADIIARSCPVCRTFGNTSLRGRIAFSDAFGNNSPEYQGNLRPGITIDRFKGGVKSGALFSYEVDQATTFATKVTLVNYELWQLGLLAYLLKDLKEGEITVGANRSKGMGRVDVTFKGAVFTTYARAEEPGRYLYGTTTLAQKKNNDRLELGRDCGVFSINRGVGKLVLTSKQLSVVLTQAKKHFPGSLVSNAATA